MRSASYWQEALIASEALADEIDNLIDEKLRVQSCEAEGLSFNSNANNIKENIKGILLALLTLKNETDEEQ